MAKSPFTHNPFAAADQKPVDIPPAPETHESRKPRKPILPVPPPGTQAPDTPRQRKRIQREDSL